MVKLNGVMLSDNYYVKMSLLPKAYFCGAKCYHILKYIFKNGLNSITC